MKDKTEQILKAAIKVFINKGFIQATTQEIAKEADVAEVTLYRKFSTKQNLFESVIAKVLKDKFATRLMELADERNTEIFFRSILVDRLDTISKNHPLVKLLITESIMGNLPKAINFPDLVFESLKGAIESHFTHLNKQVDSEFFAKQLASVLVGHAILPSTKPFHKLKEKEKEDLLTKYTRCLMANLQQE